MEDISQLEANFNEETGEFSPYDSDQEASLNFDQEASHDPDQEASRKELAKMITMHEYPLNMVEHEGFRKFVKSLNPCAKLVSRNTIKNDCLKVYDDLKKTMMSIFNNCESRVAIAIDMWTSSDQDKRFMAVTGHYIDSNWKLQSRIIRFIYVPVPQTSEVLFEALFECFLDWNIDRNLSTITIENCSTNDGVIKLLQEKLLTVDLLLIEGKLLHMRCCAQVLNMMVKDGLDVIGDATEKVRDSFLYWSETLKRREKFRETTRQLCVQHGKKLLLDYETRWNSTYLMLETAVSYKDVFVRLKLRDSEYECLPSEDEWNLMKEICGRLKLFYNVTPLFTGTQYPTCNLLFPEICEIKLALSQWLTCGVEVVESMSSKMMTSFEKYWSDVHEIMGVATVFDPRYKLVLLEYYFEKIYGNEGENKVEKILGLCRELFLQYEAKNKINGGASCSLATNTANKSSLSEFDLYASTKKRKALRSELDEYLEEDVLPRTSDFDVLEWWKISRGKYPILYQIARDVLAIPVSTVASKSAFCTSGRLISAHRSSLDHETIEALMCTQNWTLGKENSANGVYATALDDWDEDDEEIEVEE